MPRGRHDPMRSLALRLAGLLLLVLGALAIRQLSHLAHAPPRHEASAAELGFATIGFVSVSAGSALSFLGRHVFDEVELSARWARQAAIDRAVRS